MNDMPEWGKPEPERGQAQQPPADDAHQQPPGDGTYYQQPQPGGYYQQPQAGGYYQQPQPGGYYQQPQAGGYYQQPMPPAAPPPQQIPPSPSAWQGTAPRPGVIPLRPLGLGDIIDGAVSTMRAYPKVMLGVAAAVITISQLIALPFQWQLRPTGVVNDPEDPMAAFGSLGGDLLATGLLFLAQLILTGFITVVIGKAVIGRAAPFADVWADVRPRLPRLIGLTLLSSLLAFVTFAAIAFGLVMLVVGAVAALLSGAFESNVPVGAGMAVFALFALGVGVVGLWVWVRFLLATPALILERCGVFGAFGRSWELVRGSWWRVFGIWLLTYLMAAMLGSIIVIPFALIGGSSAGMFSGEVPEVTFTLLLMNAIGTIIAYTITLPFQAGATALIYTDQRIRREGLDIELARSAGMGQQGQ